VILDNFINSSISLGSFSSLLLSGVEYHEVNVTTGEFSDMRNIDVSISNSGVTTSSLRITTAEADAKTYANTNFSSLSTTQSLKAEI
jgi:hypothetical protein